MEKTLIKTRRFEKETYNFYLYKPSYAGEKGCCGIEVTNYIEVETPDNWYGYPDHVHFYRDREDKKIKCYTSERYLQPWIKKELCKNIEKLILKYDVML